MDKLFLMLNAGLPRLAPRSKKVWMEAGVPAILGPRTLLTVYFDIDDADRYLPRAELQRPGQVEVHFPILSGRALDLSAFCNLAAAARAVLVGLDGVPVRLLMEFAERVGASRNSM